MLSISRAGMPLLIAVLALAASANGQDYDRSYPAGGPFFRRDAVLNAPFSADATTTIRNNDTAHIDTVTARYYRDSQGRVRAELDTPWGPYVIVELPTPETPMMFYTLDLNKHTYRVGAGYYYASRLFNGEGRIALPVTKVCFRTAPPVLVNASDDERLRAVSAQVSPDLGIVTASRRSDRIGTVDYEVTNIRREEPSEKLFDVTDYTFVRGSFEDPLVGFALWQSPIACKRP